MLVCTRYAPRLPGDQAQKHSRSLLLISSECYSRFMRNVGALAARFARFPTSPNAKSMCVCVGDMRIQMINVSVLALHDRADKAVRAWVLLASGPTQTAALEADQLLKHGPLH